MSSSRYQILSARSYKGLNEEGIYLLSGEVSSELSKSYVEEEKPKSTVSVFGASFLLWTDVAGVGALAAGYNMAIGGVYFAIVVTLVVAFISEYTLKVIYYLYDKYKNTDYVDLCTHALGKPGRFFACLFMFVYNFGILCANLLVVGSAVPDLLVVASGGHESRFFERELVLLYAFGIILPVCFLKNIASYTWTSALYVICFIGAVIIFVVVSMQQNFKDNFDGFQDLPIISSRFISAVGSICFVFVCHDMSFSIAASLKDPSMSRWTIVCRTCMVSNIILTLGLGLFSFSIFRKDTEAFPPDNYSQDAGTAINIARLLIVLMTVAGAPYACFLPRHALETMLYTFLNQESFSKEQQRLFHIICTLLVPIGAVGIAEAVEDLGLVLSFLGGFSAAGLAFILPPLAYIRLESGPWWSRHKISYCVILAFGIFSVFVTIVVTIQAMVNAEK